VTDPRRSLGSAGEDRVARWYSARGYEVVARNWRVREGEIDLVLRTGRTIVFCEVRRAAATRFGSPFDAVTRTKQQRLRGLAVRWLAEHRVRAAEDAVRRRPRACAALGPPPDRVLAGAF